MRVLRGRPSGLPEPVLGRVAVRAVPFWRRRGCVLVTPAARRRGPGYLAKLCAEPSPPNGRPTITGIPVADLGLLEDGDVVLLEPDGTVHQLWDADSRDNVLFVTDACNCRCLICPQPRGQSPGSFASLNRRILRLAELRAVRSIALTGGEPTLLLDDVFELLSVCKRRMPGAEVALLTNGRRYRDRAVVARLAAVRHPGLVHCVSLQADVARVHDEIMGAEGAFDDVVLGLHNLARCRQAVEIRVVLARQNVPRLPQLAEFIYRNFPFVSHVALMGMEVTGCAAANADSVWVDPQEYAPVLSRAVREFRRRGLRASLYNLPYCLLPTGLHKYACDSISDWKKAYVEACVPCVARDACPGVFATSARQSAHIRPFRSPDAWGAGAGARRRPCAHG